MGDARGLRRTSFQPVRSIDHRSGQVGNLSYIESLAQLNERLRAWQDETLFLRREQPQTPLELAIGLAGLVTIEYSLEQKSEIVRIDRRRLIKGCTLPTTWPRGYHVSSLPPLTETSVLD